MFYVRDANNILVSRHRVIAAAGRVALARLDCRVRDREGKDVTYTARDAGR